MISFEWRHFRQDIISMLVRWYVGYSLSYRDIEELALERDLKVDHSTINRWVLEYSPQLEEEFRKRHKRPVGLSWRMDETYIKVNGNWVYLYRAVDKEGKTVDFMLSEKRDEPAARAFFEKAIGSNGLPEKITMDKSGANKAGIDTINLLLALLFMMGGLFIQLTVRQIKYLNNIGIGLRNSRSDAKPIFYKHKHLKYTRFQSRTLLRGALITTSLLLEGRISWCRNQSSMKHSFS